MSKRPAACPEWKTETALVIPEPGDEAIIRRLKRPALLFKRIAVFQLPGFWALLGKSPAEQDLQLIAELEWLADKGIVVPFENEYFVDHYQQFADDISPMPSASSIGAWLRGAPSAFEFAGRMATIQVDLLRFFPGLLGSDRVLVCNQPPLLPPPGGYVRSAREITVLDIVLPAFPEPNDDTAWERILEFRSDPDAAGHVLALKRWMLSKIAQQTAPGAEIREEIEWLIHEYQAHMNFHRMKINTGVIETLVTTTAEVAENIVKLKIGALARSLFSLKQRRIQLLEAERPAPGRELAYIVKAHEVFGRTETD